MNNATAAGERVAIIGAGPGGLVAAKYLQAHGFTAVLFDRHEGVGGQWDASAKDSPVWPSLVANTSQELTCFSDLGYPEGTPVFPGNREVLGYLRRYAEKFGLLEAFRPRTQVDAIEQDRAGWRVRSRTEDGTVRSEIFDRVIVASGRYRAPSMPPLPGIEALSARGSVIHSSAYKGPDAYRGKRVLVLGASISAVEIASELALGGARQVICANRRQRYVLQKLLAGVPTDQRAFTRFAALAGESLPQEASAQSLKELIVGSCGSPEQFGAPAPHENVFAAGITQSQHYLSLVAEGRILPKAWPTRFDGATAQFADGSCAEVDAVVCATGFQLDLPFLGERLRQVLKVDRQNLDLFGFTFHPRLPGLAFLGMYCLVGPHLPVLELQSRWITYAWSGVRPLPSPEEMEQAMAAAPPAHERSPEVPMHALAVQFARAAGVEPDLAAQPELLAALAFGPLTPVSFRLTGPDSLPAETAVALTAAAAHRAIRTPVLSRDQHAALQALAAEWRDPRLTHAAFAATRIRIDRGMLAGDMSGTGEGLVAERNELELGAEAEAERDARDPDRRGADAGEIAPPEESQPSA